MHSFLHAVFGLENVDHQFEYTNDSDKCQEYRSKKFNGCSKSQAGPISPICVAELLLSLCKITSIEGLEKDV